MMSEHDEVGLTALGLGQYFFHRGALNDAAFDDYASGFHPLAQVNQLFALRAQLVGYGVAHVLRPGVVADKIGIGLGHVQHYDFCPEGQGLIDGGLRRGVRGRGEIDGKQNFFHCRCSE